LVIERALVTSFVDLSHLEARVMKKTAARISGGLAIACLLVAQAVAAETKPATTTAVPNSGEMHYRASKLEGMKVLNPAGEDLGKVNDFVIDMNSGKVVYAALEFGGWLGLGDKLFAVPFSAFKHVSDKDHDHGHLVLDATKERLKTAPGFDKSHWPDMANPEWARPVNQFYNHPSTASTR